MSTPYPGALDDGTSLPNPSATSKTNNPSHSSLHANANDSIKAIEAKVGTGASTPTANTLLRGTGVGTSSWAALTSAQLAASLSDETGSGAAVFATSPTLVTPSVDTINESTPANGVTVDGLNLKDGKLNTNSSVVTANITNAAVTPDKLGTGASTAVVATSENTASAYPVDLATVGPAVTVTIGANGLALVAVTATMDNNNATGQSAQLGYAVSGATTVAASTTNSVVYVPSTASRTDRRTGVFLHTGLNAGSTTFTAKYGQGGGGTATYSARQIAVVPL